MDPNRLDRELARRGWNATDLAKASGISVATISAARRGRPVSNATLCKVAEALRAAPIVEGVDWYQYDTTSFGGWPTPSNPYAQPPVWATPDNGVVLTQLYPVS